MSIPRSGKGKIGYTKEDGAEFSASANLTMSWSSFQYTADTWVDVSWRTDQSISSADQVKIKPSSLNFDKELVNSKTIRIKVPYSSKGYRFSVEFDPQLYTAYNDMSGPANDAGKLTTSGGGNNRAIHTEPRNSMMIFAEPTPTGAEKDRLIPTAASGSIHYPEPGQVTNLNNIDKEIIYFRPGTYTMGSKYHAVLPPNVKWVYLAPGAYVKGAFRFFHDNQSLYKVTGYGVLSGEQYVYEADTNNNYDHLSGASNCHASCVKMLQFHARGDTEERDALVDALDGRRDGHVAVDGIQDLAGVRSGPAPLADLRAVHRPVLQRQGPRCRRPRPDRRRRLRFSAWTRSRSSRPWTGPGRSCR